jgi:RNA ligase
MKLFEYVNEKELREMMDAGYINMQMHPSAPLYIYNYSKMCQIDKMWNDTTEKCRGLIVDSNDNIVSRPFPKFYNFEEFGDPSIVPNLPFEVYEKLDGTLGIMYWIDNQPLISTRGSFTSDQAIHATHILHTKYKDTWKSLDKSKTYLFEIIYPEDLHVVTYKGIDDIFLLAVIDTEAGSDEDIYNYSNLFQVTKKYDCDDWRNVRNLFSGNNREGFVVKFSNGFRMKLKYQEYMRLHFLKAGFTENRIFEYISNGEEHLIDEAMTMFDEEHKMYYQAIIDKFFKMYSEILDQCKIDYRVDFETQKDAALYFNTCKYPAVLFAMRSGRDTTPIIWKIVDKNR